MWQKDWPIFCTIHYILHPTELIAVYIPSSQMDKNFIGLKLEKPFKMKKQK